MPMDYGTAAGTGAAMGAAPGGISQFSDEDRRRLAALLMGAQPSQAGMIGTPEPQTQPQQQGMQQGMPMGGLMQILQGQGMGGGLMGMMGNKGR